MGRQSLVKFEEKIEWRRSRKKKTHARNFEIWALPLNQRGAIMVGSTLIQWQRSNFKITGVGFFFTAPYFCLRSQNFTVVWLWAAITPVQNLTRPISSTFSESSGRQLSDGPILDFFSLSKFRGTSVLWEKVFFCIFAWPHRENFQVAADRTILTPAGFPIAHLKAYALKFSGNMWKMQRLWKLGVPAPSKVTWSRFVSP